MRRYIDADVLKDDLVHNRCFYPAIVASAIRNTPTADVVEVVRCGECRYCKYIRSADIHKCDRREHYSEQVNVMDYCSYGERREENEG